MVGNILDSTKEDSRDAEDQSHRRHSCRRLGWRDTGEGPAGNCLCRISLTYRGGLERSISRSSSTSLRAVSWGGWLTGREAEKLLFGDERRRDRVHQQPRVDHLPRYPRRVRLGLRPVAMLDFPRYPTGAFREFITSSPDFGLLTCARGLHMAKTALVSSALAQGRLTDMEGMAGGIGVLLMLVFAFWIYIWLPASMAADRGRSSVGWVILTILFSPFITISALLVLGPTVEMAIARMRRK